MSRLDHRYLYCRGLNSWREAYREASKSLMEPDATFKNLRDEFDPIHLNPRKGWHMRPLRANRQTVMEELKEVSDDALMVLVEKILSHADTEVKDAIDALARITKTAANVAERLLTGRRAEEYFIANCSDLVNVLPQHLVDLRNAAVGYDFGITHDRGTAIEVKGIKEQQGNILFTDREWVEAKLRKDRYLLVVVGNLVDIPKAVVVRNPSGRLMVSCRYQKSISVTWSSTISII